MTSRGRLIAIVVIGLVAVWGGYRTVEKTWLTPRAELVAAIGDAEQTLESFRRGADDAVRVEEAMRTIADRSLGGDVESVDHRVRTRLNRIAEEIGLAQPVVGTGEVRRLRSPARRAFPRSQRWRPLRDEIDAVELDAWVTGRGTLEEVIALVDRVVAEPWPKRITQLKLDPKDGGAIMAVAVRLTTFFVPGRSPSSLAVANYDSARLARFDRLRAGNPFALPEPETPVVAVKAEPEPPPPPPPPPYPYGDWLLTGIAQGPDGPEAWLRNVASGETRRLAPQATLERVVLAEIAHDAAVFEQEGTRFRVLIGHRLDDRDAVNQ